MKSLKEKKEKENHQRQKKLFSYYGAKTKIIKHYPKPTYKTIVEPFAGSARYSLEYFENNIILYELFDKVYLIWKYLIQATEKDILFLPDLKVGDNTKNIKSLSDVERWLIGYHIGRGSARPSYKVNERCRWNTDKIRIANNLFKIRHWKIYQEDGTNNEWNDATYFIDPPYMVQKHGYNFKNVNYNHIKEKIENGKGQFIVCGNSTDTWIDFKPLVTMMGNSKQHIECVYIKE